MRGIHSHPAFLAGVVPAIFPIQNRLLVKRLIASLPFLTRLNVLSSLSFCGKLLSAVKRSLKLQLSAFALALLLLAAAIAWTARTGWREVVELREGLEIAEQFDAAVTRLNGVLRSAETKNDPREWERLLVETRALDAWIDGEKERLTSPRERELLTRTDVLYDRFRSDSAEFIHQLQRGEGRGREEQARCRLD